MHKVPSSDSHRELDQDPDLVVQIFGKDPVEKRSGSDRIRIPNSAVMQWFYLDFLSVYTNPGVVVYFVFKQMCLFYTVVVSFCLSGSVVI
jgi:hypothetical protein